MKSLGSATTASYVASGVMRILSIGTDPCLRQELDAAIPLHTKEKIQKGKHLKTINPLYQPQNLVQHLLFCLLMKQKVRDFKTLHI